MIEDGAAAQAWPRELTQYGELKPGTIAATVDGHSESLLRAAELANGPRPDGCLVGRLASENDVGRRLR